MERKVCMSQEKDSIIYTKQKSEIYKTLLFLNESTDDYLFLWDLNQHRIYFTSDLSKQFKVKANYQEGFTAEEWFSTVYPLDVHMLQKAIREIHTKNKRSSAIECRLIDLDNRPIWVTFRVNTSQEGLLIGKLSLNTITLQIDPITELRNSIQFYEDFDIELRNSSNGYLLLLGLDDFKTINTRYGRPQGNKILFNTGKCIEECLPSNILLYRLDGDRFAVKLTSYTENNVASLYHNIQNKLPSNCTISAGAVAYSHTENPDANIIFQQAELALDQAKQQGKNTLTFFSEREYAEHLYIIDLKEELRSSIHNQFQGFELYFQPQIQSHHYELCGAEALLRYNSQYKGIISPNTFIPILEQTGMIIDVGKWILHTSIQFCAKWRKYIPNFEMSVNLSYLQLKDDSLYNFISNELEQANLPGSALILELTESIQLQDFNNFNELFYNFEKQGIKVSIDDFGTGYSSLGYLKHLTINEIKIDRCFVNGIQSSAYNYRLLSNIIELADSVHIDVCCEGIEKEEELAVLEKLRPNKMQGYLFGRPVAYKEFEQLYVLDTEQCQEARTQRINLHQKLHSQDTIVTQYDLLASKHTSLLNQVNDIFFVSDSQTHEIYYLNQEGQQLTGALDYEGRKCYKVLYGRDEPCKYCTKNKYQNNAFSEWIGFNSHLNTPILMRHKKIIWNGKEAFFGIGVLLSNSILNLTNQSQDIWISLLKSINLYQKSPSFKQGIEKMLMQMGQFYKADRCSLFLHRNNEDIWERTFDWNNMKSSDNGLKVPTLKSEYIKRWISTFEKKQSLIIADADLLESDSKELEMLRKYNIYSLILQPLIYEDTILGFIGVTNPKKDGQNPRFLKELSYYISIELIKNGLYDTNGKKQNETYLDTLHETEIMDILKVGVWSIQIDTVNKENRMYMNARMKDLCAAPEKISAEELFQFWYNRISDGYNKYIQNAFEKAFQNKELIEIEYTWVHPTLGEIPVRARGKLCDISNHRHTFKGSYFILNGNEHLELFQKKANEERFEFNAKKHTLYFHTNRSLIEGSELKESLFPLSWIQNEIVHPYFKEEFLKVFTNIQELPDDYSFDILLRNKEKMYNWFHLNIHRLGEEEKDRHTLYIILTPFTQNYELPNRYVRKDDFYHVILSETVAFIEVDLEADLIQNAGGAWSYYFEEQKHLNLSFSQSVKMHVKDQVKEEDFEAYLNYLDIKSIKKRYEQGEKTIYYDFQRKMEDGYYRWMRLTTHVFEEQINKNLYALMYLRDIDADMCLTLEREKAASYDHLTDLLNRKTFQQLVETYINESFPQDADAFLLIDLDDFKSINDTYGHLVGDQALISFSQALTSTFRKSDYIGRIGGDEFVVFVKDIPTNDFLNERLITLQDSLQSCFKIPLSCSIGISIVHKDTFQFKTAFDQADKALYESKNKGKHCFSFFEQS